MKIFSNLALSVDGRIADYRSPEKPLGTTYDRRLMKKIRAKAEVLLVGAGTLRVASGAVKQKNESGRYLVNAVVSDSGKLPVNAAFWKDDHVRRIIFTSKTGYSQALKSSKDRALVVSLPRLRNGRLSMMAAVEHLKSLGFQSVLVEGGGQVIASFLQENLLHEMFLTLTPLFLGGGKNPALFSTEATLPEWKKLKLLSSQARANELYLHYKVLKPRKVRK